MVRARASSSGIRGCELESRHLTGHRPTYRSTNAAFDNAGTGLIIMCPMRIMYIVGLCVVVSVLRVRIKYIIGPIVIKKTRVLF